MNLEYKNNEYILKLLSDLPLTLNDNFNIMINGTTILLPTKDFINKIKPYYEIFSNHTKVIFPKEEENRILKQLIPTLNSLSDNLILSSNIQEK